MRSHPRLVVLFALVALIGCGDSRAPRARHVARHVARAAAAALLAASTRVADVPGAARAVDVAIDMRDLVPLDARLAPRRLPVPRVSPGHSGTFTFDGSRRGWFLRLPDGPQKLTSAAYSDGRIYLGGGFSSTTFYGVDAKTGRIDWASTASDGGPTAAIVEDDKVVFNTESCTLFVVDAKTGRHLWSRWLGDPLMSQPAAAAGRVFSAYIHGGGDGYRFGAFAARSGTPMWERRISADVLNAPVLDAESIYFTTMDGGVWRMDQRTGRVLWHRELRASSAPSLDGERVLVARRARVRGAGAGAARSRAEQSITLSRASGATERTFDAVRATFVPERPDSGGTAAGWGYEGSRPTIVDGRIYQTIGDEVQCRDARTGELLWRRRYPREVRSRPASSPAVTGSQLVFGTEGGQLFGLDIDTGLTAWAYDVGEPISAEPIVAKGWVYATTTRGGVVGVEVSDRTLDGWHMWGGNAKHAGPLTEAELAAHASAHPEREDERPPEGTLRLNGTPRAGELPGFPLEATRVSATVRGPIASVTVEQTFANPYTRPIEAAYLFPLPDDAAVDAMELRAGARRVRGHIARREDARREYRQARDRGVLASLLEQERPNLFQQSVANIRPGDRVRVTLHYVQTLPYEGGSYRLVYPMVAGPRYTPAPRANADRDAGAGTSAHAPAQHVLAAGGERRDRVEVSVDVDAGCELAGVSSPTHRIEVSRTDRARARVTLADSRGAIPDRDLDLRFRVGADAPKLAALSSAPRGADRGYLTLVLHPRLRVPDAEITPRELVFVVDTSSSMRGRPIELAKAAIRRALDGARPTDTIRVVRFSDAASELSAAPLSATRANIDRAKRFVSSIQAGGATEMKRGLRAALGAPVDASRMRIVLLLTDGYIGNETEIFREVHDRLGSARVFAFGVGSAVNRYLLTRVAEVGRGDTQVVTLDESPAAAADAFHARIAKPYVTDLALDWGGLGVTDVYPRRLPDLFADRPLVVHGRFARAGEGDVIVAGRIAGRPFTQRVHVRLAGRQASQANELGALWARTRIRDLMTAMALRPSDALREEVIRVGLAHGLMTDWTSFVAVDEGYRSESAGAPARVDQPATLPSGVDYGSGTARVSGVLGVLGASGSGETYGFGGLGMLGTGRGGGGGTGEGTIGLGALGSIGHGAASATSTGYASAAIAERRSSVPRVRTATAVVHGSLSSALIHLAIRRQHAAIRYCYEQALRSNPDLQGRVTVTFIISPQGTVSTASILDSTLGSPLAEACIVARVRETIFPTAPDLGPVVVNYPFAFEPAREDSD